MNIKSPFLSTLELSNDGSKPVPASDFESPIELSVDQDTQIVRARVTSVQPNNLKAELDTNKQSINLRPLLLNSKGTMTIAVITSGSPPNFVAQVRIAGISKIKFEDTTTKKENWKDSVRYSVTALLAFVLYWIYGAAVIRPTSVRLSRVLSMTTMLVCGFYTSWAIHRSYEIDGVDIVKVNIWTVTVAIIPIDLPVLFFTLKRTKR